MNEKSQDRRDSKDSELLTAGDVASRWGVSVETVRRWDRDGLLTSKGKNARGWRYYLFTDVQELLRNRAPKKVMHPATNSLNMQDTQALDYARSILSAVQQDDKSRAIENCVALLKTLTDTDKDMEL